MEIDGYAFCLGVNTLGLSYTTSPELRTLPSVIYLIERAGLRSKHIANLPEVFSLNICCLAELIDMFHTRKASNIHDKVYALLGMSSDDPDKAGLRPDYEISWKTLFQKLVKFVLGKYVSVETSDYAQRAVIESKGCILGQVSSVRTDDKQKMNIIFISKNTTWCFGDQIEWTLQASAKSIREHDIVCFLEGASKPTIIRLYKNYFVILVIAVTPLKEKSSKKLELKSITNFPRDFLLIWDWEQLPGEWQNGEIFKNLMPLDEGTRKWNIALILEDLEEYKEADIRLQKAIESYEIVLGKESSYFLKSHYGLTPLLWAAGNGYNAVVNILLSKYSTDPDLKNRGGLTPLWWAVRNGHDTAVKLLLDTGKVEADLKDDEDRTPLSWAAHQGYVAIVKLLLETGRVEADLNDREGRTPLSWAAHQGYVAIVKLLLETGKVEANSKDREGWTPLLWAAHQGHAAIVKLLLETGKVEADLKDRGGWTPLQRAARKGHTAVVKLLLETGKIKADSEDRGGWTPLSWAAQKGHTDIVKLLLETGNVEADLKDREGRTPLWCATYQDYAAIVKLLLETGKVKVDLKDREGRTLLSRAANQGQTDIVKLLLETGKVEADSKDRGGWTPLLLAARKGHTAVVKLLLETGKVKADSKEEDRTPLGWATSQGHTDIVKLLLEHIN
jgi:ankyrin repeat protein